MAAAQGHTVTVLGAGNEPGGKTRLHATLPGGENLSSIYDYQQLAAARHGVTLVTGVPATFDAVLATTPDTIVLATGSTPDWPVFLPSVFRGEGVFPDLREAVRDLDGIRARQPGTVVVFDADHGRFTYTAAERFAAIFARVVVVTPRERIAADEAFVTRQTVYQRLADKRIEIVACAAISVSSAFEDGSVTIVNVFNGDTIVRIDDVRCSPTRRRECPISTCSNRCAPRGTSRCASATVTRRVPS